MDSVVQFRPHGIGRRRKLSTAKDILMAPSHLKVGMGSQKPEHNNQLAVEVTLEQKEDGKRLG